MRILKTAFCAAFDTLGGPQVTRWRNRHGLRILMYHRFSSQASLATQCAHLKKHYTLLSLDEVADHLENSKPFPRNSVALTVDDGYRDFLEVAFPIFARFGIPVTLFVVSRFIDGEIWLWPDVVRYLFEHTSRSEVTVELPDGNVVLFDLHTPDKRIAASRSVTQKAKEMRNSERLVFLDELPKRLQVAIPRNPPAGSEPMSWQEIRHVSRAGIKIGAHTRTHPILSRISSSQDVRDEVAGSKVRIEEQLQEAVRHFCYPNGKIADIGGVAIEAVSAAGYSSAVTTEIGLNDTGTDKLLLKRIGVEPDLSEQYFRRCVAGFRI